MSKYLDVFYYDKSSPSGLRWLKDRYAGANHNMIICRKDSPVGSFDERSGYWRVSLYYNKIPIHHIIWEMHHGEVPKGFIIDHIDRVKTNNIIENMRLVTIAINSRNCKLAKSNTSGFAGVSIRSTHGKATHWRAAWCNLAGRRCEKNFSISVYGNEGAFQLACSYRVKMIQELNEQGAGYSKDHGKVVLTQETLLFRQRGAQPILYSTPPRLC